MPELDRIGAVLIGPVRPVAHVAHDRRNLGVHAQSIEGRVPVGRDAPLEFAGKGLRNLIGTRGNRFVQEGASSWLAVEPPHRTFQLPGFHHPGQRLANGVCRSRLGEVARNEDRSRLCLGNHFHYGSLLAHLVVLSCHKNYIIFVT